MSERVSVDKQALKAFIRYAGSLRSSVDAEYNCSKAEDEASTREWSKLLAALDRQDLEPAP